MVQDGQGSSDARSSAISFRIVWMLLLGGATLLFLCLAPVTLWSNSSFLPRRGSSMKSCRQATERPSTGEASVLTTNNCSLNVVHEALYAYRRDQNGNGFDYCPDTPPLLVGDIKAYICEATLQHLDSLDFRLELGGHYRPKHCTPKNRAALIIPFRNRWGHLSELLLNLHPFLQKQNLEYTIYVINQADNETFNRGLLMNIGALVSSRLGNYDCFIFHDVDLIPLNDNNLYGCPHSFHHFSAAIDKFDYKLPYASIVGGALSVTKDAFEKVNGFSTLYFGWGGEDDDMAYRITQGGFRIERYSLELSKYKMIKHGTDKGNEENPERHRLLLDSKARSPYDGLKTTLFSVAGIRHSPLFTLVNITVNKELILSLIRSSGYKGQI